jgi:hypothetical protein
MPRSWQGLKNVSLFNGVSPLRLLLKHSFGSFFSLERYYDLVIDLMRNIQDKRESF